MMRTSYDPEADAFYARFAPDRAAISETREVAPGVMLDLDANDNMVGIDVLSVSVRASGAFGATVTAAAE